MKSKKTKTETHEPESLISEDDLDPKNVKVRITTMISEDILQWLRTEADALGIGYQTFLSMKLREAMTKGIRDDHYLDIIREMAREAVREELKRA